MAAVFEKTFFQNLQGNLIIRYCPEIVFSKDNLSNEIIVKLYNGESEYSGGGTVSATVIRADGRTVPLTGTLTGNVVSLALIESCMEVPGQIQIFIRLTSGNVKTTVFAGVFTAVRTETDTVIDPGTIIPSVTDLINQIDAAIDSIPADYSMLLGSVAGTYSTSKTYAVGDYVWYNGALYRCTTAISTAESWTAAHWTAAVLGNDISVLKSAITQDNEYIYNVSQSSKNLFNPLVLSAKRPGLKYENGVWYGDGSAWVPANAQIIFDINDTDAIRYTLSFEAKVEGTATSGSGVFFKFIDGTGYNQIGIPNNTSDWTEFTLTSRNYNAVQSLTTVFSTGGNNICYIRNLQLEVGTSKTAYIYPLTAYDKKADARLNALDALGLTKYPITENWAYESYVNFMVQNPFTIDNTRIVKSNGATSENSSYICTDYLYVPSGKTVYYKLYSSNGNLSCLYLYNIDKSANSSIVNGGMSTYTEGTYTATDDCFIRASYDKSRQECYLHFTQNGNVIDRLNEIQDVLPAYWETYLSGKENDINGFIANVGNHGDYFLLFTDYHIKANVGYTPAIIHRMCKRFPIDKVINCGDILNSEPTKAGAESVLGDFFEQFNGVNLLNVFGNHDSNPYGSGASLTQAEVYNFLFKRNEQTMNLTPTKDGYYYLDNPLQKIRYIVLNTRENGFVSDDKTAQLPWLINTMKSVETGWYICIVMHMGFEWYDSGARVDLFAAGITVKTICDAYQNRESGTVMTDVSFDFTTGAVGKIACVISGHAHVNTYVTSDAGYSIIGFDRDALNYPPPTGDQTRTAGNVTEQSFALVSIDTTAKKVSCLGIGAGTDREFTFE